ncbi:acetyltransferase [Pontibacter chinhatensis]|uniref:Sugar O-acyltransferase, sialic acid O-acetyltransferase NeuD family n=1 Tax=Pontibacter chinhatensis TaxID=1436961 RepID=A0A1I2QXH5_9BACT|nr:acetyltransferase [Pontibacter chinhatensis]SFG33074.1 sugar O-acyltransferase, sialic acid O-acetyltransferase NeuD family [Pontibacter chinhatensis]
MKGIALFGYSGHAYVVADAILEIGGQIIGYFDQNKASSNPFKLNYLGNEQDQFSLDKLSVLEEAFFVAIGNNLIRRRLTELLTGKGYTSISVIHPRSIVSKFAIINCGTFVAAGAMVNAMANVGQGVIINTGAVVEHECEVGNYTHIAPGAVLAGNVRVGEGSFIGANAVVKQGVSIGRNAIVGAGAVVLKDIADNLVWVGNPAKNIRNE